jgi:NAD(P)H-hydrate epimerase
MPGEILRLTRSQVREIDRRAIEEYHVPGIVLMENAARAAADAAWEILDRRVGSNVLIVCGSGNNGGDGLAIARHLHNRGAAVHVSLLKHELKGDAAINYAIVKAMKLLSVGDTINAIAQPDLIIDSIFGTGLDRAPTGAAAEAIESINRSNAKILAIDVPSGLDCDTGKSLGVCVRATRTITFVAEKVGFANPDAKQFLGEVIVGDIGCPRELIEEIARMSRS